jgi:hypothetical protein
MVATHQFNVLAFKHELPGDLGEIAALPGLGPKRVKLLYDNRGIRSLEGLRRAVGPAARTTRPWRQKLAAALAKPHAEKRFKLSEAEAEAQALLNHLRASATDGQCKGATRAFDPEHESLPSALRPAGQPVLIGGSMGTSSYVLAGEATSEAKAFSSACHGAGRALSRHAALKKWSGRKIIDDLASQGS